VIGMSLVAGAPLLMALSLEGRWILTGTTIAPGKPARRSERLGQGWKHRLSGAMRWIGPYLESALVVAMVPLALLVVQVAGTDPARDSWQSHVPQFAYLAILNATSAGLRVQVRVPVPAKKASSAKNRRGTLPDGDVLEALQTLPQDVAGKTGILMARGVTTGWWDCMHGDLWIFPDGLLRIPRGWARTLLCPAFFFNPRNLRRKTFDLATFAHMIHKGRNLWIPADTIVSAALIRNRGLGGEHLRAVLGDGRCVHLMWIPIHRVFNRLEPVLAKWIGGRLQVRG
jgi:hypothetical protein